MTLTEIQQKIEQGIANATVTMTGDGCNCSTTVISSEFANKSLLVRQKMILSIMSEHIQSGEVHALSIKAYTHNEAKNK